MFSLNVTHFLNTILDAADYEAANINFILLTWIIITILLVQVAFGVLRKKLMTLLTTNHKDLPEVLLHKVIISRELKEIEKQPSPMTLKYDLTYLLSSNQNIRIQDIFGLDLINSIPEYVPSSNINKETLDKIFLFYLEDLLTKFPKNSLIKLHTAYTCFKNNEPYTKTIKSAIEIEKNKWSEAYLSSSLLLYEIEKSILADHNHSNDDKNLDFYTYIRSKVLIDDLRKRMLEQTDLYIKVCDNITSDISNIGEIHRSGQSIADLKISIQKKIDYVSKILPDYFISPYLTCAEYHLIINHSVVNFEKYCDMFAQRYFRTEKYYKETSLIEENLYQDTNAFLLLSTQKGDSGKILFCNKSLMELCGGGSTKGYLGSHISSIFSPSLRSHYDNLFKQTIRAGDQRLVNKHHRAYLYHKNKYIIEADFCLKYHPYLTQNLCFDMIIRPVPTNREYILMKEDGEIEGGSCEIAKFLKLSDINSTTRTSIYAKSLSDDLVKINTAFNMVHKIHRSQTFEHVKTAVMKFQGDSGHALVRDPPGLVHNHSAFKHSPTAFAPAKTIERMTEKEAFEIYNSFTTEDQVIVISPYEKMTETSRRKKDEGYLFYTRVELVHFGTLTMKLISLRETDRDEEGPVFSDHDNEPAFIKNGQFVKFYSSDSKRFSDAKTLSPTLHSPTLKEEGQSENFDCEEKDDFTRQISTTYRQSLQNATATPQPKKSAKRNFFFPISPRTTLGESGLSDNNRGLTGEIPLSSFRQPFSPATTDRKTLISPSMKKKLQAQADMNSGTSMSEVNVDGENKRDLRNAAQRKAKVQKYISSHHSSQRSVERTSNKAFRAAIIKKSYPKSFVALCVAFYGIILITFISQIIMKVVSDSTMKDLQTKKDLLKNSEQRSYKAALIQINAIGAAQQLKGALSSGGVLSGVPTVVTNLQQRLEGMQAANEKMVEYAYSLDEDIQKELFREDVTLVGTYLDSSSSTYSKEVNNFQAAQEFTNAVKALKGLSDPVSTAGYNMFNYLNINIMDDFQYKSVQITDLFTNSVEKQKQSYQSVITLCLVLTPSLLAGIGVLLALIIFNQYRIEQKNLKAFIKIKPTGVKDIADRLASFKKNLINEETFESKWFANLGEDLDLPPETEKGSSYSKKHNNQIIRYNEFRQRYMKYIGRVAGYIFILIGITIWDLVSTKKAIKVIYNYQDQLQFANYISSRVTAGYASFPILFFTNNTMKVEHLTAYEALAQASKEVTAIQSEIPGMFLDVDGNYIPDVKTIIYDNDPTCSTMPSDALSYCQALVNTGQPVNMIAAVAVYQGYLSTKTSDYENADKSTSATILASAYKNIQTFLPNFYLIATEAQMIADVVDVNLTSKISETENNRTIIIVIFSIALVIVSTLIWFHILQVIREVYNDFKKVLQIFPPSLVLSSYLLKKFLKRTSNEPLLFH